MYDNNQVHLLKTHIKCFCSLEMKNYLLASMVPFRTFKIHRTFPLRQRYFVVDKRFFRLLNCSLHWIAIHWKVLWRTHNVFFNGINVKTDVWNLYFLCVTFTFLVHFKIFVVHILHMYVHQKNKIQQMDLEL